LFDEAHCFTDTIFGADQLPHLAGALSKAGTICLGESAG
jgi:hypothetical protein